MATRKRQCPMVTAAAGVPVGDERHRSIRRNNLRIIAIMIGGKYGHKN